jgi:uncharacterized protein
MPRTEEALQLSPQDLSELRRLLRLHLPAAEVWAYGSRVRGQAHAGSDLDLVVRQPEQLHLPLPGVSALREAVAQSSLPILVEVHDWAALPPEFRREIDRHHQVL